MRVDAKKPEKPTGSSAEANVPAPEQVAVEGQQPTAQQTVPKKASSGPAKILFGETISGDGTFTPAHEAELARIAERAKEANGRDPGFKQKQFTDWHGWCHWRASFARSQVNLHQADADRWELRKKGRDVDREQAIKAKIETEVKKINAHRAKLGKAPLTAEQAAVVLS